MSRAIAVEIVGDASSVQRAFGKASVSAKNFDKSLSHTTRGAIAGSGVFRGLGRSLAFASGGFLAFEGITSTITNSIRGAESLEKAQRGLAVAIKHTGGNLRTLKPQYEDVAKAAAQFGINQADATTSLERATVLTGDATKAQHAYEEALVISKATGKDFNAVLTATAKGQEGVTTSLQRYGILIKKGTPGQEQFNTVMARFGGQAKANTSTIDRFNATWQNTEEILGTALLPTLNSILTKFTAWLTKMQDSGRLQKDVNTAVRDGTHVFHALESVIKGVDKVTGSFAHTLELLIGFKLARVIGGWGVALTGLIGKWRAVRGAAIAAEGAEAGAAGAGAGVGVGAAAALAAPIGLLAYGAAQTSAGQGGPAPQLVKIVNGRRGYYAPTRTGARGPWVDLGPAYPLNTSADMAQPGGSRFGGPSPTIFASAAAAARGPHIFTQQFGLKPLEQLAQAQAALTRGTTDDVAAAKEVVARIKRLIAEGRLKGKAMLQALGLEANALSTIWSAEDAAAQKRAQAAAAAKARIAAQIQNSIDPAKLELQLSKDQALGRSTVKDLLALKRAAEKALASGKLSVQQQIQAWDQIAQINQQLASTTTGALGGFKQANTRKLTAGLGLTPAQRKALRARLSQLGPGGTVPGGGTGAFGFVIGKSGHVKGADSASSAASKPSGAVTNASLGHLIRKLDRIARRPIHVTVDLDGRVIADSTTRYQQRRRRRSSSQRRGPNAGD